jgi:hypothetical protein
MQVIVSGDPDGPSSDNKLGHDSLKLRMPIGYPYVTRSDAAPSAQRGYVGQKVLTAYPNPRRHNLKSHLRQALNRCDGVLKADQIASCKLARRTRPTMPFQSVAAGVEAWSDVADPGRDHFGLRRPSIDCD